MTGILDGKVVLVTGGAGGIGRECALLAAREGARVVVNDIGQGVLPDQPDKVSTAETTAAEIRASGGDAVSNSDSVTEFAAVMGMVEQAITLFGGLDAVINPAGILRDNMLHKMTEADWDSVIAVHLRGAFNISRAAVGHFRDQGQGAFVHFGSTSGLIGNLGQSNYGAAKMGVAGLSRILAMEGASRGIRSNVIAPFAWTQMTASIPVRDEASRLRVARFREGMRADQVAPLAVALASDGAADVTGQIFGARGNEVILFSQPRPVGSASRPDGWSASGLVEAGLPSLRARFTDLGASASIFNYDPI
ncbi:SDR family NAD(P)-dependent oxidoreductase [Sphingobium sp. TKS]|uniref:SDR family NAD(P)-dependent oxidoreductase n=1 Tax=Sphingobium sp. TKS TaxID=1315974 RepID=UPI00077036C3|nr:SDR family NAD(P)-dependent oxidoreductase [Sphingobium sp. TKS]AMK25615.1 short-chain dehydrogenase [Sphingobium sp. TKS]